MNLFFILLLFALIAAGYYVYQRLLKIEREIRADKYTAAAEDHTPPHEPESTVAEPLPTAVTPAVASQDLGLREQVLLAIAERPGLAQTELYGRFPDAERRELQKLLRELDQSGKLKREKKGNSYQLYPL